MYMVSHYRLLMFQSYLNAASLKTVTYISHSVYCQAEYWWGKLTVDRCERISTPQQVAIALFHTFLMGKILRCFVLTVQAVQTFL